MLPPIAGGIMNALMEYPPMRADGRDDPASHEGCLKMVRSSRILDQRLSLSSVTPILEKKEKGEDHPPNLGRSESLGFIEVVSTLGIFQLESSE
jgi:hypothetical protein